MGRVALALLLPVLATSSAPAQALEWRRDEDRALALWRDDALLWRLAFDPDQPHSFFHPLALPGVEALTVDRPADHVWHHGLWFSWKFLNGVNYWEHERDGDAPAGRTLFDPPVVETDDDGRAIISMRLRYAPPDADAVLREQRLLVVQPPASDGSYVIDWTARFVVMAESLEFERTPLPGEPGGRVFGGYAGLSLRLLNLDDREVVAALDEQPEFNGQDRLRTRAAALEYQGTVDDQPVAIAILAHPDNIRSPSPWYVIRSSAMTFISPAVICYEPLTLSTEDEFTLRYRICVHPTHWDEARLKSEAATFAAEPRPVLEEGHK